MPHDIFAGDYSQMLKRDADKKTKERTVMCRYSFCINAYVRTEGGARRTNPYLAPRLT